MLKSQNYKVLDISNYYWKQIPKCYYLNAHVYYSSYYTSRLDMSKQYNVLYIERYDWKHFENFTMWMLRHATAALYAQPSIH